MEELERGVVRIRRKPRLGRMRRELKAAEDRGRRAKVERRVAEAIEAREALVNYCKYEQDLITPTKHLGESLGGDISNEMRGARVEF